ncbi:LuxR C-terminal-related transcriptional regulator, partial [Pseudomonas aeruginosa]|uniref:LuxR C-terminal-related transcriptional regulator n=1 Tax=Pseudomonas aeruginosa TaxID=287 RepID=UPI0021AB3BEF
SLHFLRSSTPFPAGQIFSTPLNAKSQISVICNCSEANVNFHMGNIRRKFGVTSRRVAAIMAVNLGLITL